MVKYMTVQKKNRQTMPYGPASDFILKVLSKYQFQRDYLANKISREEYLIALRKNSREVNNSLLNDEHLCWLAREYQPDFDKHALSIFSDLVNQKLLRDVDNSIIDYYGKFRNLVGKRFNHGTNHTFIQPDEAHLLYLISMSKMPLSMIAIGSYYGYWAVWAMPGLRAIGGSATLIDPNSKVCRLAKSNFKRMHFKKITRIFASKAEDVLPKITEPADLVLLDASGSHDSRNKSYRGKGIYSFLIEPIWEKMAKGGILVVHNDKPSKRKDDVLKPFHKFCSEHFRHSFYAPTPEGIGIYWK